MCNKNKTDQNIVSGCTSSFHAIIDGVLVMIPPCAAFARGAFWSARSMRLLLMRLVATIDGVVAASTNDKRMTLGDCCRAISSAMMIIYWYWVMTIEKIQLNDTRKQLYHHSQEAKPKYGRSRSAVRYHRTPDFKNVDWKETLRTKKKECKQTNVFEYYVKCNWADGFDGIGTFRSQEWCRRWFDDMVADLDDCFNIIITIQFIFATIFLTV